MLSQPATKIFLKTTEPNAAEWVSRAIGKVEIERMKETHFDGSRDGRNFSLDRQTEPLVLDSEISGLENLNAYLKYGNYVTRFSFPLLEVPASQPKFIERLEDDFIVRELRKEQKEQPEAAKNEERSDSPTHAESKPTSDGQNRKSPVTKPASEAQKKRPADSTLDPKI
jgi:type IV secretory pathway TraG/TraD family ATPase VirD4